MAGAPALAAGCCGSAASGWPGVLTVVVLGYAIKLVLGA